MLSVLCYEQQEALSSSMLRAFVIGALWTLLIILIWEVLRGDDVV